MVSLGMERNFCVMTSSPGMDVLRIGVRKLRRCSVDDDLFMSAVCCGNISPGEMLEHNSSGDDSSVWRF